MYKDIYRVLERTGRVKTAVILSGEMKGCRCMEKDGEWITGDRDWNPFLEQMNETAETKIIKAGETEILVEIFCKSPRLIILGGGHVSCPTAKIGKMLGFHVTVMDDREEFLTRERFPEADLLIKGSFEELSEKIPVYENAYYVVVTRGHKGDTVCARQILRRPYVYFGMIGSRTKVRLTRENLLEDGYTEEQIDTIHAPIGLPIGGQFPEEIAVSITAEIVQEKNRRQTSFVDEKVAEEILKGRHGVLMTIVKKSGSSPRGVGSRMFLDENGNSWGSIGGGSVEFEAMKHASSVKDTEIRKYGLSVNDDRNLGMVCGGRVEILFERV